MSIQSDVEMLSIQAMEAYAKRHHLSGDDVMQLFYRCQMHDYDVVIGPVADDNTMETIQLYISGVLTAKEAVERLRYNKVNNQVSFHTKKALAYLRFIGRDNYE